MFEMIWSHLWPSTLAEKLVSLTLLVLYIFSCFGPFQDICRDVLSISYILGPIILVFFFIILLILKQFEKAYLTSEIMSLFVFYGIICSWYFWKKGIYESIFVGFLPLSGMFIFGCSAIVVVGGSHFHQIKHKGLDLLAEEETPSKTILPKSNTLSYFSTIIGEYCLLFLSFILIMILILRLLPITAINKDLLPIAIIFLIAVSTCFLSIRRDERLFWFLFMAFCVAIFFAALQNSFGVVFATYQLYLFMLFGLSVIYSLVSVRHHIVLVGFLIAYLVGQRVIESILIFGKNDVVAFFKLLIAPAIIAIFSVYLSKKWTKKENTDNLLTVEEVAEKLNVSKPTVYKLIRNGHIRAGKVGSSWRVPKKSLNQYLNEILNH